MFGSDDISIFFQDGPVCTVQGTGQSAHVIFDFPEEIENFGNLSRPGTSQGKPRIQYATASLDLSNGTIVTIQGAPGGLYDRQYKVASPHAIDDGSVSVADLNKL